MKRTPIACSLHRCSPLHTRSANLFALLAEHSHAVMDLLTFASRLRHGAAWPDASVRGPLTRPRSPVLRNAAGTSTPYTFPQAQPGRGRVWRARQRLVLRITPRAVRCGRHVQLTTGSPRRGILLWWDSPSLRRPGHDGNTFRLRRCAAARRAPRTASSSAAADIANRVLENRRSHAHPVR